MFFRKNWKSSFVIWKKISELASFFRQIATTVNTTYLNILSFPLLRYQESLCATLRYALSASHISQYIAPIMQRLVQRLGPKKSPKD